MKAILALTSLLLASCTTLSTPVAPPVPHVDYHQHLVSGPWSPVAKKPMRDAAALLAEMDRAGIRKAVVLSVGYSYADERKKLPDPDGMTRAENDWTSGQVAGSRGRLIGFCSANPLRDAALAEIERCLGLPGMRGVKLHFGNAGMTLRNPGHVSRLQQLFALAQRKGVPILAHMRPRGGADYGAQDVTTFLDKLMPLAPGVPVIIAHLGASSPGYPPQNDEVMGAFAAARKRGDRRVANIYFDVSGNVDKDMSAAEGARIAHRMRQIGVRHFLYGTDLTFPDATIAEGWALFRTRVPLTPAELRTISNNRLAFTR